VHVVVDQAGNHGTSAQVDAACGRCRQFCDFGITSHGNDPVAANGDRLRQGKTLVDGDDLPVRQDHVWRGLLGEHD